MSATQAAAALNAEWERDPAAEIFSQIGAARGGWSRCGGVLWSDFRHEPKTRKFRQVVGHTVITTGPAFYHNGRVRPWSMVENDEWTAIDIDVGAKGGGATVCGAWIEKTGVTPVRLGGSA